uniref:Auxin response factor n=1 Tax=Rhizophora mucronata TaxID=61149 RepID=A0A2P2Q8G9_RHIMU
MLYQCSNFLTPADLHSHHSCHWRASEPEQSSGARALVFPFVAPLGVRVF